MMEMTAWWVPYDEDIPHILVTAGGAVSIKCERCGSLLRLNECERAYEARLHFYDVHIDCESKDG